MVTLKPARGPLQLLQHPDSPFWRATQATAARLMQAAYSSPVVPALEACLVNIPEEHTISGQERLPPARATKLLQ